MTEPDLENAVYVPVTNVNYVPEGIVQFEGYVNPDSGGVPDDKNIATQKTNLENAGLVSGPNDENAWVDPNEPDEEAPVAEDEAPAPETDTTDTTPAEPDPFAPTP